jgi:hypothetical protein
MTDRELLELAAKAAGLDVRWIAECQDFYEHRPHMLPGYWDKWNPLTDDADAFRLAVKLSLDVLQNPMGQTTCCIVMGDDAQECEVLEDYNGDPYAATRRAIVRAAAEIGRSKT